MEKQSINEEMRLKKDWFQQAHEIHTIEELAAFANKLLNEYDHDYGTVCHAISALALAGAWLGAHAEGITGFQAGFVMWDFIKQWNFRNNECGLKLLDYDKLLYPQYADRFEKTIEPDRWERIKKVAAKHLAEDEKNESYHAHPDVIAHWKSIAEGNLPFGFTIKEDE